MISTGGSNVKRLDSIGFDKISSSNYFQRNTLKNAMHNHVVKAEMPTSKKLFNVLQYATMSGFITGLMKMNRSMNGLMKKSFAMLLLAMFSFSVGYAQITNYKFTASTPTGSAAYADITGGTTIVAAGSVVGAPSAVTPIGFTFNFLGRDYTHFSANAAGLMKLNNTSLGGVYATAVTNEYVNNPVSVDNYPKLYAWWDQMYTGTSATGGGVSYVLTGTAPNRVLTVQWNLAFTAGTATTAKFQIKIYETSNKIEYFYGTMPGATASTNGSVSTFGNIGMGGLSKYEYLDITPGAEVISNSYYNNANLTIAPPAGRKYEFLPKTLTTQPSTSAAAPTLWLKADQGAATTVTYTMKNLTAASMSSNGPNYDATNWGFFNGALYNAPSGLAWIASSSTSSQTPLTPGYYLQLNLGSVQSVDGIATRGGGVNNNWVTDYIVKVSSDGTNYVNLGLFQGNEDASTIKYTDFPTTQTCQYIRIYPAGYVGWRAMRVDAYTKTTTAATDGQKVRLWNDQSVADFDAYQPSAANQLTYKDNQINFNPALVSANASNTWMNFPNLDNIRQAFWVVQDKSPTGTYYYHVLYGNSAHQPYFHAGGLEDLGLGTLQWSGAANNTNQPYRLDGAAATMATKYDFGTNGKPNLIAAQAYGNSPTSALQLSYQAGNSRSWEGPIAEVLLYQNNMTAAQVSEVETYLAIKYGITKGEYYVAGTATDGSAITTNLYPTAANAPYNNAIFGIARNDAWGLHQRQSRSVEPSAMLTIGNNNIIGTTNASSVGNDIATDNSYLIVGDNNGALGWTTTTTTFTGGANSYLQRIWKAQETGTIGSVKLTFNANGTKGAPLSSPATKQVYVIVSNDATFDASDATTLATYDATSSTWSANVDLANGQYFTLATYLTAPGGVGAGMQHWLKADNSSITTANGAAMASWPDASIYGRHMNKAATGGPLYQTNVINFNPAVVFDGAVGSNTKYFAKNLSNVNHTFTTGFTAGDVFGMVKSDVTTETRGFPWDYGAAAGARGNHYTWSNATIYDGFGSNARVAYDPLTAYTYKFSALDWSIYNTYTATNNFGINRNGNAVMSRTTNTVDFTMQANGVTIGAENTNIWKGKAPEIILYNRVLSTIERQQVNTYMAIKYGVTLPHNYVGPDGTTILWNATTNATYHNNIFGIARSNIQELHQRQSKSIETGSTLTIGNNDIIGTTNASSVGNDIATDNSYLIVGDNNGAFSYNYAPSNNAYHTLNRVWKLNETGTIGSVKISIPGYSNTSSTNVLPNTATATTATNPKVYLVVDNDGNFNNGGSNLIEATAVGSGATLTYEVNVDLSNSTPYFTWAVTKNITNSETVGDNSVDMYDVDDDNDGVLDFVELNGMKPLMTVGSTNVTTKVISGKALAGPDTLNYTIAFTGAGVSSINAAGIPDGGNGVHFYYTNNSTAKEPATISFTATPIAGEQTGEKPYLHAIEFGPNVPFNSTAASTNMNDGQSIKFTWDGPGYGIVYDPNNQLSSHATGDYITSGDVIIHNASVAVTSNTWKVVFYPFDTNAAFTLNAELTPLTTTSVVSEFFGFNLQTARYTDTDGDGLPNHNDTDSDGDGCTDAFETGVTGATASTTTVAGTYGVNGLSASVESSDALDATVNYTATYALALNADMNTCLDTDSDGVNNAVDIDDDNDGIIDADELACESGAFSIPSITAAANTPGYAQYTTSASAGIANAEVTVNFVGVSGALNNTTQVDISKGGFQYIITDNDPAYSQSIEVSPSVPTMMRRFTFGPNVVSNQIGATTPVGVQKITLDWNPLVKATIIDPNDQLVEADGATLLPGGTITTRAAQNVSAATWKIVFDLNGYTSNFVVKLNHRTTSSTVNFANQSWGMDIDMCASDDADNDGVINSLDTDSDGDGCPDAYEASATGSSPSSTSLTGAVGANGLLNSLENNDTQDAVTTFANTNYLAYSEVSGCADTDSDGISDKDDLDDDNDGVLDVAEYSCDASMYVNSYVITSGVSAGAGGSFNNGDFRATGNFSFSNLSTALTGTTFTSDTYASNFKVNDANGAYSYKAVISPNTSTLSEVSFGPNLAGNTANAAVQNAAQSITLNWSLPIGAIVMDPDDQLSSHTDGQSLASGGVVTTRAAQNASAATWKVIIPINFVNRTFTFTADFLNAAGSTTAFGDETWGLGAKLCTKSTDADGDGKRNAQDTDADGDGCSDLVESKSGKYASLTSLTIAGAVGANGVPNVVETNDTKTTGINYTLSLDFLKSEVKGCTDTDNDKVPNEVDIDDDNDGVLDQIECPRPAPISSYNWNRINANQIKITANTGAHLGTITVTTNSNLNSSIDSWRVTDNSANGTVGDLANTSSANRVLTLKFEPGADASSLDLQVLVKEGGNGRWWFHPRRLKLDAGVAGNGVVTGISQRYYLTENYNVGSVITPTSTITTKFRSPLSPTTNKTFIDVKFSQRATTAQPMVINYTWNPLMSNFGGENWGFQILEMKVNKSELNCDPDGDGISNELDLDSDGDGCLDGYEANSASQASALPLTGPVGANGFVDALETVADNGVAVPNYSYSYAINSGINACLDFDNDGIADLMDIDDDNDGVLDAVESPNCFYTAAEWNTSARSTMMTVTSDLFALSPTNDFNKLTDNLTTAAIVFSTSPAQDQLNKEIFKMTFARPTKVDAFYFAKTSATQIFAANVMLQGSNDNITWTNLQTAAANPANATNVTVQGSVSLANSNKIAVSANAAAYKYYRIFGSVAGNILAGSLAEIYFDVNASAYQASNYPKAGSCAVDTDTDSKPNHMDTDSDGDGCPDARESGTVTTAGTEVVPAPYGLNGFGDGSETAAESGIYKSVYTYATALDPNATRCNDTDGDDIPAIDDIDDDNDGIPDLKECPSLTPFKVYTYNRTNDANVAYNLPVQIQGAGAAINYLLDQRTAGTDLTTVNTFNGTNTSWKLIASGVTSDANNKITVKMLPTATTSGSYIFADAMMVTNGTQTIVIDDNDGFFAKTGTWTDQYNQTNGNYSIGMRYAGPASNQAFATLTATWTFEGIENPTTSCDEDGDGVTNQLDLDSDGDGCSDAYEAGTTTNKTANYSHPAPWGANGLTDALETVVDNGTTNYTSTYNTYATEATKNFCDDKDGDGISDYVDIDDDNDGILDNVECPRYEDLYSCKINYPSNVVKNPGFETGNLTNWTTEYSGAPLGAPGIVRAPFAGYSGSYNSEAKCGGNYVMWTNVDQRNPSSNYDLVRQTVTVLPNTKYEMGLSAFEENAPSNFAIYINGQMKGNTGAVPNRTWTNYKWYYTTGPTETSLVLGVRDIANVSGGDDNAFDNVYMIPVDARPSCDTDGDGIPNDKDTDSDNDGCNDGVEGGSLRPGQDVPVAGPYGANGFADGLETTTESGIANYVNTYDKYAKTAVGYNYCLDSDKDGIVDEIDIDDDNDGVLDTVESTSCVETGMNVQGFTFNGVAVASKTVTSLTTSKNAGWVSSYSDQTLSLPITLRFKANPSAGKYAMLGLIPVAGTQTATNYNDQALKFYMTNGNVNGRFPSDWTFSQAQTAGEEYKITIDAAGKYSVWVNGVQKVNQVQGTVSDYKLAVSAYSTDGLTFNNVIITETEYALRTTCTDIDTDGDGVANRLDLDSDGDGCNDATEAGSANVATTAGGSVSSTGVIAGTYGPNGFADKLEKTAAESGLYNGTYSYLYATDKFANACLDSDKDGISDLVDIDDDNDGVLDTVECNLPVCSNTITNGGFESPVVGGIGSMVNVTNAGGWGTTDAGNNVLEFWRASDAAEGGQYVELNAYIAGDLYQKLCGLSPGTVINWSVKHKGRSGVDVAAVKFGKTVATATSVQTMTDGASAWGSYSGTYTVPDGQTETYISFAAVSSAGGNISVGNFIDDVQVSVLKPGPCSVDTDGDGIPNSLDLDSDGDGCNDAVEAGAAPLGTTTPLPGPYGTNGLADNKETATDNGITTYNNTYSSYAIDATKNMCLDTDGDGMADIVDADDDNDGILDTVECPQPYNGVIVGRFTLSNGSSQNQTFNGFPDELYVDIWSLDNSFKLKINNVDIASAAGELEFSNTVMPVPYVPVKFADGTWINNATPWTYSNSNAQPMIRVQILKTGSVKIFGIKNGAYQQMVLASGTFNTVPINMNGTNTVVFGQTVYGPTNLTAEFNGVTAGRACLDTDGDGVPDSLDLDSDGDGVLDVIEAGGTDANGDGRADGTIDVNGVPSSAEGGTTPQDTDGDGKPNWRDLDSDGDGINDVIEASPNGANLDTNGDGKVDGTSNNQGIPNNAEGGTGLDPETTDTDASADMIDLDSDGDGIPDKIEGTVDTDGDGIPDFRDTDSDNDGILDANEDSGCAATASLSYTCTPTDSDGDGIPNYKDLDSDNDGILDSTENAACSPLVALCDTDGDGTPNYIDLDADGDGISDVKEAGGTDANGDGKLDGTTDQKGLVNGSSLTPPNTDGTGGTNPYDIDSDGDGITDNIESGCAPTATNCIPRDTDGDGIPDYKDLDSDNDGIPDEFEGGCTGSPTCKPTDTDGDGTPDYRDLDSDNDGKTDASEDAICTGAMPCAPTDTDADGTPDFRDTDSDNDGVPDNMDQCPMIAGSAEFNGCTNDADNDGIIDTVDLDDDNDGILDTVEAAACTPANPNCDTDGDGIPNRLDSDSDNDGINDVTEAGGTDANNDGKADGTVDTNGVPSSANGGLILDASKDPDADGKFNPYDVDSDGDGITDAIEKGSGTTPVDSDNDGTPDYLDTDSDGDGIPDKVEGTTDTDGDGTPDYKDVDSDGDGILDAVEDAGCTGTAPCTPTDTDGDGTPDYKDLDSDADGIADAVEKGCTPVVPATTCTPVDTDGDGTPNYLDKDSDGDGIPDSIEGTKDSDGDGTPDYLDVDSDGDGIPDSIEDSGCTGTAPCTPTDTDGDGTPNYLDKDSDGDGILDATEDSGCTGTAPCTPTDTDGDGTPNYLDKDSDADGIPDAIEKGPDPTNPVDTDKDGTPDYLDTDSDNDGIPDSYEGGCSATATSCTPTDTDGDGLPDYLDKDSDNDGITDNVEAAACAPSAGSCDTDGDGTPNFRDLDSDGDGISDVIEGGGVDSNGDGLADGGDLNGDGIPDTANNGLTPPNTDGTGGTNPYDVDSDGDGILDSVESGCNGTTPCDPIDTDNDGIPDYKDIDSDNDGILDSVEAVGCTVTPCDTDGDGTPDYRDLDSDADGLPDSKEGTADIDGDGIPNFRDPDSDGDGVLDKDDTCPFVVGSADNNGCPLDFDGDGLNDDVDLDDDNDGILDTDEAAACNPADPNCDVDGDGIPNRYDYDSDGDGISDVTEAGGTDADKDGKADGTVDANGVPSSANGGLIAPNTDGDARTNPYDVDSDGDGLTDNQEKGCTTTAIACVPVDTDGDGTPDYKDLDSDGDGIPDSVEKGTGPAPLDTDGDGTPDYLDVDSDNDGIPDSLEDAKCAVTGATSASYTCSPTDTDGDGTPDYRDLDSDGDGLLDNTEDSACTGTAPCTPTDTDGDGTPNFQDLDSDGDGVLDNKDECVLVAANTSTGCPVAGPDNDGDGILDVNDPDDDNDGILDTVENGACNPAADTCDTDGDGIPNRFDLDSDGDGIKDVVEGSANGSTLDANNDGIVDGPDANNDGVPDAANGGLTPPNTDGTGGSDPYDLDSDGDGIPDSIEKGTGATPVDTDGDGTPDYRDLDSDNDGIPDNLEDSGCTGTAPCTPTDTDGDGTPDYRDLDSDADGIPDSIEKGLDPNNPLDTDGDGVPDYRDTDSDGDGISDNLEDSGCTGTAPCTPTDTDGDGTPDYRDLDSDADGIPDSIEKGTGTTPVDSDGDGTPDYRDTDSDGDGIPDSNEDGGCTGTAPCTPTDTDKDGIPDYLDKDSDNDGILDATEIAACTPTSATCDTDGDGVPNYKDLDSDGDGISDVIEGSANGVVLDANGDGMVDGTVNQYGVPQNANSGNGLTPPNTDGTDGTDPYDTDADGDGIIDSKEGTADTDGDGIPNFRDLDSDGDGIPDSADDCPLVAAPGSANGCPADSDGDGVDDINDLDDDNDGILDTIEDATACTPTASDCDGDGIPNSLDKDSDGDGINDVVEGAANGANLDTNGDGKIDGPVDANGVPVPANGGLTPPNTDGTAGTDPYDTDADGDGISDNIEKGPDPLHPVDTDGDGVPDYRDTDSDNDGISDALEGTTDTDGDGVPNYKDLDSDGDGALDAAEKGTGTTPADTDGDGLPDYKDLDSDNDGILDSIENAACTPSAVTCDTDNDGIPNYKDLDSDGDGISDVIEGGGTDADNDGKADGTIDANGVPASANGGLTPPNTDGTGGSNPYDVDSDGDGILDSVEKGTGTTPVDTDNDGIPDYKDKDSDNDGIPDLYEGSADTDGDNIPNYLDLDSDGDGIPDSVEDKGCTSAVPCTPTDTDSDGIPDYLDKDSDNDGILDSVENAACGNTVALCDTDGDGTPNYLDKDSDNDGITDVIEGSPNGLVLDANGDGMVDGPVNQYGVPQNANGGAGLTPPNTDGTGGTDPYDTDADGDGILDSVEKGSGSTPVDTDKDGIADYRDLDSDGDGVSDAQELIDGTDPANPCSYKPASQTGTTATSWNTLDCDGDGLNNLEEKTGINDPSTPVSPVAPTDPQKADTDGDGVSDGQEAIDGTNPNDPCSYKASSQTGTPTSAWKKIDCDGDGLNNGEELTGIDDPTTPVTPIAPTNPLKADTDGDGVSDSQEAIDGTNPNDPCSFKVSSQTGTISQDWKDADCDGDGVSNGQELIDGTNPNDGCDYKASNQYLPNTSAAWKALDCDGDGTPNGNDSNPLNFCIGGTTGVMPKPGTPEYDKYFKNADCDGDGISNDLENKGGDTPLDSDGDGIPNYMDADSDGDGIPDAIEKGAGTTPVDTDKDGIPDFLDTDSDNDGIPDSVEDAGCTGTAPCTPTDTDGDGIPNYLDLDSDGDGISDEIEKGKDGTNPVDTDKDGTPDYLDLDSDNDGIPDAVEKGTGTTPVDSDKDGIPDYLDTDSDNDGIPDSVEDAGCTGTAPCTPTDTDGDGVPNYLDLDSDNDGIPDAIEKGKDGNNPVDTDKDGIPDYLDLDSDGDGIPDSIEKGKDGNNPVDTDKDGIPDYLDLDSDGDGAPDNMEDTGCTGTAPCTPTDSDNDGIPNYLDLDSDNDGCPDAKEALVGVTVINDASYQYAITYNMSGKFLDGPLDKTVNVGENVIMTTTVNPAPGEVVNFQWQVSKDNGVTFTNIVDGVDYTGANRLSLTINNVTAAMKGYKYRVVLNQPRFACGVDTSRIALLYVNTPPKAVNDVATTPEDSPVKGNVLGNDTDADGDKLVVSSFIVNGVSYPAGSTATIPGVGTFVMNADGSYTFTPAPNYYGPVPPITYIVKDTNGATASAQLDITVQAVGDPEDITITGDEICGSGSTVLKASSVVAGAVYKWYSDSLMTTLVFTGASFTTPTLNANRTYYVSVTGTNMLENQKGNGKAAIAIVNPLPPTPTITASGPTTFCKGDNVILRIQKQTGFTYQWYSNGVAIPGATGDSLFVDTEADYSVRAISTKGCQSVPGVQQVKIPCVPGIYVPTVFTPNGDGINDVLLPVVPGMKKFQCFQIYNRWGNMIFEGKTPTQGWNGTYKGSLQPNETYIWVVLGEDRNGKPMKSTGTVTLVR